MLCGRRPFAGDSRASLMAAIVSAEPPTLTSLQPQMPASLERLILRCLAKDPDDRWQTARDLAAELRWIAERARHNNGGVSASRAGRAAPLLWGGVAGAALTAGVFAATAAVDVAQARCRGISAGDVPQGRRVVRSIHTGRSKLRL